MNIKRIIPKEELEHGAYYEGESRAGTLARWDGERQEFRVLRGKYGLLYTESHKHIADETFYDAFSPLAKTTPPPGVEIAFYGVGR